MHTEFRAIHIGEWGIARAPFFVVSLRSVIANWA
jgi:hypothetical protein